MPEHRAGTAGLRGRVRAGVNAWRRELCHRNRSAYGLLRRKDLEALCLTLEAELSAGTDAAASEDEPYKAFAEQVARIFADGDRRNLGTGSRSDTYQATSEDLEALRRLIHEARKLTGVKPDTLLADSEYKAARKGLRSVRPRL